MQCDEMNYSVSKQTYTFDTTSITKLHSRAFVNAGWIDLQNSIPGYFYTIGVKNGVNVVLETNSPLHRC
jgi:hypothetical protein